MNACFPPPAADARPQRFTAHLFRRCVRAVWPSKPIRVVVPFPLGGGTDTIACETSQRVAANTGWTFVIDNKPGAGGNLGVDTAAKAAPDGYTLVLGQTSNLAINPTLYSKMPYDSVKDLEPADAAGGTPEQFAALIKDDISRWGKVVKDSGAKVG